MRAIAAATTVLPTSVPVPVTKTPLTPRLGGERGAARRREAEAAGGRAEDPRRPLQRPGSWVAIAVKRRREVPSGTVGGRIPWAKTPCSSSASESRIVCAESPTSTGTIWLSERPTAVPPQPEPRAGRPR